MKKRLLITSIVMMLVVAVALSTATYAWFTSNTSVTATQVTMTAGTSSSSALGIAWTKSAGTPFEPSFNNAYTTSVSPYVYSADIQPAAPKALTNADAEFYTAFIDAQGKFLSTPEAQTPVFRFANYANSEAAASASATYSNLIHVANLAQSGTVGVEVTATIEPIYTPVAINTAKGDDTWYTLNNGVYTLYEGEATNSGETANSYYKITSDATNLVRIAIFEVSGEGYTTYTYKGLLGKTAGSNNTAVGTIATGTAANTLLTASTTTTVTLSNLAAQEDHAYAVYVWLDGALFDEAESGKQAKVSLTFSSTEAA